ncbi:hypothetical protein HYS72_02985 [Candidatus Pacearchaeota archaeon]|nr:hypothetical protein [Candidatus Pacearchaeota archaeon]
MELEKLFLKKEELPILYKSCFQIPIHPKLLNEEIKINENIATRIFSKVAQEWYEDLKNYSPETNQEKEWIKKVFLKNKPKITKHFDSQILNGVWQDDVNFIDNGLVQCFSICRNSGGSIYFNNEDINCQTLIPNNYLKFSEEKTKEFEFKKVGEYSIAHVYSQHNIDAYPGALFLRNWAITYMNEVFKQIFS